MKSICIEELIEDMQIAVDVVLENSGFVMQKGKFINKEDIKKIAEAGLSYVYIKQIKVVDTKIYDFDISVYISRLTSNNGLIKRKGVIPDDTFGEIEKIIKSVYNLIDEDDEIHKILSTLRIKDYYTYEHSLNVGVLSALIAMEMEIDLDIIEKIVAGAILHDIGKINIENEYLNKPGKLTDREFEILKSHSTLGYNLIKNNDSLSELSKNIILSHHEKLDGSGYPNQCTKGTLTDWEYISIVSFADMFDAMTNDRVYKKKLPIYRALELLSVHVPNQLHFNVFRAFKNKISPFPLGTIVELTTGEKGVVISNTFEYPTRPVV